MIYLFDKDKKLINMVSKEHIQTMLYEREKNGLYTIRAELPVIIHDKDKRHNIHHKAKDAVFLGHYDREDRFQLHKVVLYDVQDNSILIKGVHTFFDEAKAGATIRDRRYINREAHVGAQDAFETIGWSLSDYDPSPPRTYNFYNISPLEARQTLIETFGFEFDFWLDFDGTNIRNKQFSVKRRLGGDSHKRYTYDKHTNTGDHVISLQMEQDHSEVYTAVIGRGRGEEIEETGGFGRRIEFTDEVWTKPSNPLNKPAGSRTLEDPDATTLFGYYDNGTVKPRIKVIEFPNIEDTSELLQASYEWLMENNVPKAVFSVNVADGDGLELGDSVWIIYNEIGLKNEVRVGKVTDDLLSGRRDVELGDVDFFKVDRTTANIKNNLRQQERDRNSLIYQLKLDFDRRFDEDVAQMFDDYEQALIDALAEVEARRERMENEWQQQWDEGMEAYERDKQAAYDEAERNYERIEREVSEAISSTRTEVETEYNRLVDAARDEAAKESERIERDITETIVNTRSELENTILDAEQSARDYAEAESQRKSDEVQSNLERVTGNHQSMIDDLRNNVMNIDDFLGNKTVPLQETLLNMQLDWEERLNNVDTWHYNMLRGTRFDEDFWEPINGTIVQDEVNYFKSNINTNINGIRSKEEMWFRSGETYLLSFDVQTYAHRSMDYVWILDREGSSNYNITAHADSQTALIMYWGAEYQRYWVKFTPNRDVYGVLQIGANSSNNELGHREYRIRLPYLTQTDNTRWLYHQLDMTQNLEEISRRVTQLEHGREEFITRTRYDADTGEFDGRLRHILDTVDGYSSVIQNHENWINTNGSSISQTVDGFMSKAWMSDIHNPNMLPFTAVHELEHRLQWRRFRTNSTGASYNEFARVRNTSALAQIGIESPQFDIQQGRHVATWEAFVFSDSVDHFTYCFLMHSSGNISLPNPTRTVVNTPSGSYGGRTVYKYTLRFNVTTALKGVRLMIGARVNTTGSDASFSFRYPKLEVGDNATSYFSAFSAMEQRADSLFFAVQGIGEDAFLTQSDIQVRADYVQLGSQRLGDNQLASILRVSPNSIDAITDQLNLTGNLNVKGQIESLSISAITANIDSIIANNLSANIITGQHIDAKTINVGHIVINDALVNTISARMVFADSVTALSIQAIEGEFARLFASEFEAITITGQHIDSKTINSSHINVNDALINLIVARQAFINEITTLSLRAVDADIGRVRAAILTANVINSGHIEANTVGVNQINVNDALINVITARQAFIREIRTISIEAVEADIGHVRSVLLDANVITANHIAASHALIDKIFMYNAYIENLTAKAAFVRDVRAISIDAFEINLTTLMNSMGQVEGGLSIRRPDGDYYFNNGMAVFDFGVQMTEFRDPNIDFNGQWWETSSANQQRFNIGSFKHVGRKLKLNLMLRLSGYSPSISEWMYFRVRSFGGSINYDRQIRVLVRRTQVESMTFEVDLPRLTHGMSSFYVSIWRDSDGAHADNIVQARINRTWVDS